MSIRESEIAKSLGPDDKVQKSYPGRFQGKDGTLILSSKRLLFLKEEGFLKKTYTTMLNIPYAEVKNLTRRGMYFDFTDSKDNVHVFTSEVSGPTVEAAIRELMKASS